MRMPCHGDRLELRLQHGQYAPWYPAFGRHEHATDGRLSTYYAPAGTTWTSICVGKPMRVDERTDEVSHLSSLTAGVPCFR